MGALALTALNYLVPPARTRWRSPPSPALPRARIWLCPSAWIANNVGFATLSERRCATGSTGDGE
jgi:hypothetical protein